MLLGSVGVILALLAFWSAAKAIRRYRLKHLHERIRREWFHTAETWFEQNDSEGLRASKLASRK
jgi:hypothetical protein